MEQDNASYKTGVESAAKVDCEVLQEKGTRKWFCAVSIGEEYYETDSYAKKEYAISEMLGYLDFMDLLIKTEIENLKKMIK